MILNQHPDFSSELRGIPTGTAGIRATLAVMRHYVNDAKLDPQIQRTAVDIVRTTPEKDYHGEAAAVQRWVRDNIRYTQDVEGIETVRTPAVTLFMAMGDCDDKATLAAALLASIGHQTRFVALGHYPGEFSHVLIEDNINGDWLPLETTEDVDAGWTPPDMPYRMVVDNG